MTTWNYPFLSRVLEEEKEFGEKQRNGHPTLNMTSPNTLFILFTIFIDYKKKPFLTKVFDNYKLVHNY